MGSFFVNEVTVGTADLQELVTAAGTNPVIDFYTGAVPTDASVAQSGTLLGTLTISGALGTVTAGVSGGAKPYLTVSVPPNANGIATGTPTFVVVKTSGGVGVFGCDDGASGSGAYYTLTPNTITAGAPIADTSFVITGA